MMLMPLHLLKYRCLTCYNGHYALPSTIGTITGNAQDLCSWWRIYGGYRFAPLPSPCPAGAGGKSGRKGGALPCFLLSAILFLPGHQVFSPWSKITGLFICPAPRGL